MTPEEILQAVVDKRTAAERLAYLEGACGQDAALRAQVEGLLRAHELAGSFLEQPLFAPPPTVDQPTHERPGTIIGPYKLLEQIGEGGFGVVFMAEQQEPVRRKVALKILKPGMDTKQVVARFEAERQALAIMDHPNIAHVYDGGATDSPLAPLGGEGSGVRGWGRPYFVMELVKGVPITEYCDQNHLTPRQRLELFLPVCHAVQHAHQKGIIHRDLKPSNILVSRHDVTPVVKVIDFGVAKALGQELTDKTLFTGLAQMIGTPLYMSPEQAGMSDLDVDTRSDIYSLGVLLYELLTGTTPFDKERFRQAAYDEIRRIIREEEPPKPSTRLSELSSPHAPRAESGTRSVPATLASVAAQRQTEPAKLTKLVKGELDWIVMKAMEKDRNRRYETANGFAMDIQRYLADEPVVAGPPSARYRLRKFVRRHRGAVLAANLVALTLVAGIIGTAWQAVRAEQRAEGERLAKERAQANFDLANAAVETYLGAVTDDPDLKRADFNRLRKKLLESAIPFYQRISAQKSDDPEVEAGRGRAYFRLGKVRAALGETEAAVRDYEAMQEIFVRLTTDFPAVPDYRSGLAISLNELFAVLEILGRHAEAEAACRQALDIRIKLVGDIPTEAEYRQDLATSHNNLGIMLSRLGQHTQAAEAFREAIAHLAKLATDFPGKPHYRHELADSHNNLANALLNLGNLRKAEETWRHAIAIHEKLVVDFPTVAEYRLRMALSHGGLGHLLSDLGEREKAEAAYHRSLGLFEKLAADFPSVPAYRLALARVHFSLGRFYDVPGQHDKAGKALREALGILEKLAVEFPNLPEHREGVGRCHDSLGNHLRDLDEFEKAEAAHRRALDVRKMLVVEFPHVPLYREHVADSHNNLGNLLAIVGKHADAVAAFREALPLYEKLAAEFPNVPHHLVSLAQTRANLGDSLKFLGELEQSEASFRRAVDAQEKLAADLPTVPEHQGSLAKTHNNLGLLLSSRGKHAEAEAAFRRAIAIHEKLAAAFPNDPEYREDLAKHHCNLGALLREQGQCERAEATFRENLNVLENLTAAYPSVSRYQELLANCHNDLGVVLGRMRKNAESETAYRQALVVREKLAAAFPNLLDYAVNLGGSYCNLGHTIRDAGQPEVALGWFEKAIGRLEPVVTQEPSQPLARRFLHNSHSGRAKALDALGRHADATRDWERALALDASRGRDIRLHLAQSRLWKSRRERDAAGALAAATEYEALKPADSGELYDAACHRAICAAVIVGDQKTPAADAARLAKEQADLAMAWLHKAVAAGLKDVEPLKKATELDALRERDDFKRLITDLEAKLKGVRDQESEKKQK